jgi:hypothetical protein
MIGMSALLNGGARYLAVRASHLALSSLFDAARALATAAWFLLAVGAVLAVVWLAQRRLRRLSWLAATAIGVTVAGTAIAALGNSASAPDWAALIARALSQTARHPLPFIPAALHGGLELLALCVAVLAVTATWKSPLARTALALALLSRAATDIPLLALALTLAALAAPLASVEKS